MSVRRASLVVLCGAAVQAALAAPVTLEECEEQLRADPRAMESYYCFHLYQETGGDPAVAIARLESLLATEPQNPRPALALAKVLYYRDRARAGTLAREAIEGFVREGDLAGEGWARWQLALQSTFAMRLDEAEAEMARAAEVAERAGDPELRARVRHGSANIAMARSDHSRAWLLLRGIELQPDFDERSPRLRAACFNLLNRLSINLGLVRSALRYAELLTEVTERQGLDDQRSYAATARAMAAEAGVAAGLAERAAATELIEDVIRSAVASRNLIGEIEGRMALAKAGDPRASYAQLLELDSLTRTNAHCRFIAHDVHFEMGKHLIRHEPARAEEAIGLIERSLVEARTFGSVHWVASALPDLVDAYLANRPPEDALRLARSVLDIMEGLDARQSVEELGVRLFARRARVYYRVIDFLLGPGTEAAADPVAEAFRVSERLRARALLRHLDRIGVQAAAPEVERRRRETLEAIAQRQLRLLLPGTSGDARRELERELERLEVEEAALRAELHASADGAGGGGERFDPGVVQAALGARDALLSFLVPDDADAGRVLVLTRDAVRAHELPGLSGLDRAVGFWCGALERRDGSGALGAASLYGSLLAAALEELPPGIERLVVIPDGPLHALPFDALRSTPDAPPLATRFEIELAPSAAVWLDLRSRVAAAEPRALVLADPELPGGESWPAPWRAAFPAGLPVGRLPHARTEARDALRALGDAGELRIGTEASEAFVKGADLPRFRLLHFATHALLDEEHPERSAILLAAGDGAEDGLLQAREVADLDLAGGVVTLSACRSASGAVLRGEGVMGLARSFFQARAGAVIGGLWRLGDRETAELMRAFYRELGDGRSIGAALARAKRERIAAGDEPAAWAGVVVFGAGDLAPWPAGAGARRRGPPGSGWWVAGLGAVAAFAALWFLRRRSRRAA